MLFNLIIHSTFHPLYLSHWKVSSAWDCVYLICLYAFSVCTVPGTQQGFNLCRLNECIMCGIVDQWAGSPSKSGKEPSSGASASPRKGTSYFELSCASSSKVGIGLVSVSSSLKGRVSQFSLQAPSLQGQDTFPAGNQCLMFPSFSSVYICSLGKFTSSSHHPDRKLLLWLLHSGPTPPAAAVDCSRII